MYKVAFVVLLLFSLGMSVTLGQQASTRAGATVNLSEGSSPYLTDSEGKTLYIYLGDSENNSMCYGRCLRNLTPLTVEDEAVAGQGVRRALLGTLERRDGTVQVSYNSRPLYTFARDEAAGDMKGQGVGDLLFAVLPSGEAMEESAAPVAAEGEEGDLTEELVAEGEGLFTSICATCHGDEGQGIVGPRLDGNEAVGRSSNVINTILYGRTHGGMPAFGDRFSDREIAAVGTYVRNTWSNEFGPITEEEVAALR